MATTEPPARPEDPPTPVAHRTTPPLGRRVRANLSTAELVEDAIRAGEGLIAAEGPRSLELWTPWFWPAVGSGLSSATSAFSSSRRLSVSAFSCARVSMLRRKTM